MLSRRDVLLLGSCWITCRTLHASAFPQNAAPPILPGAATARGCGFDATGQTAVPPRLTRGGLDPAYRFIVAEVGELNRHFTTKPQWQFHDDDEHAEALALPVKGGVVISLGNSLLAEGADGDATAWPSMMLGVLAHEWAHTFQYQHQLQEQIYMWETHADYLAGWYLGQRRAAGATWIDPAAFASALTAHANTSGYFNEQTHGSPAQRTNAMYAGLRLGRSSYDSRFRPDVEGAAEKGYSYVKSIPHA